MKIDLRMIQRPSCFHWKTRPLTRANYLNTTAAVQSLYMIMQVTDLRLAPIMTCTLHTAPTDWRQHLHHGFIIKYSHCQPWPEARVEMDLRRTELHWVVVVPVSLYLMALCRYWYSCREQSYWRMAGLLNLMNPLISSPLKRIRSSIILEVT